MTLITPRKSYQPFEYPEAHEYFVKQQQSHWLWSQCVMTSSVHDWETKLTEEEKKIISGTLLGFTQMELYIGNYWAQKVAQWFPKPEISLMAFTFAGMECFDAETELLTTEGWVPCPDITEEHKVAQMDMKTCTISYAEPEKVIKRRYTGDMVHFLGEHIDVCVTPNHDMLVILANGDLDKIKAGDLLERTDTGSLLTTIQIDELIEFSHLPRPIKRQYNGYVYCVSMPDTTVVCRRNGKITITGNSIHSKSYNYLNETLNLEEHDAFLREPSAAAKIENLINVRSDSLEDRAVSLAVYSAFAEGVSLYANFAVLLYFSARGLIKELDRAGGKDITDKYGLKGNYLELPSENMLKGVSEVIAYSVRDECHTPDTEVLTDIGWVRFDSLPQHCLLAQYDMETQEISYVRPQQIIKKRYSGVMVELGGKRKAAVKCRVTKDHDMVVRNLNKKCTHKIKAIDLNLQNKYEIPIAGYKLQGNKISMTPLERLYLITEFIGGRVDMPDEDGLYTLTVTFSKRREQHKIDEMHKLVSALYEVEGICTVVRDNPYSVNFQAKIQDCHLKPAGYKWIVLTHCTQSWIDQFLMELRFWRRGRPANRTCEVFYTNNKEASDMVQVLCVLSGRAAEYYPNPLRGYSHGLKIWDNKAWKNTRCGTKDTKTYSGYVYCATVDKGTLITRYKESVMISGNCMHSNAGCWLFRQLRSEFPSLNNERLNNTLYDAARTVVELEYNFIDMVFDNHELPGLNAHIVKSFIEQRTNQKLEELGLEPIFDVDKEAARQIERWFYLMTGGEASTDFFAAHVSNYAKGLFNTEAIDWDAVFA
jgi:ribonucleotide reductase beta subunit family protein with ferritin-like domain